MRSNHLGVGMTSLRTRERLTERLRKEGIHNEAILETIKSVPRHIFVDEALASRAYENTALPIGFGQTISQPYIVARMTEALLGQRSLNKVLEIGTGCGYQTAVLAALVGAVYTVERIDGLLSRARERFRSLRLDNVYTRLGDGTLGWPENAPYDGIIVTAAPVGVPQCLLEQLDDEGRLVIPVGAKNAQRLLLIVKSGESYEEHMLDYVNFVPMLGGTG